MSLGGWKARPGPVGVLGGARSVPSVSYSFGLWNLAACLFGGGRASCISETRRERCTTSGRLPGYRTCRKSEATECEWVCGQCVEAGEDEPSTPD